MQPLAYIPSPSQGIWHIGPVPIRAYAIMIILGIVAAVWLGERRWAAKGGAPGVIIDVAVWAVPFGLVGGRLYHVITDYQRYFGEGGEPVRALEIWKGGLGIWGAIALGALGALIGCRRRGISLAALADAVAPGIALAQAIGRWGNYWNQELYGRPLDTFWAIEIDEDHRPMLDGGPGVDPKYADVATYHPTFLYESLWCIGVAILVIWADRRFKLTHGRAFALYVAAYTVGRAWIEALRIDDAHHILGLRLNDWTSILLFLGAVAYLYKTRGRTGPENVGAPAKAASGTDGSAGATAAAAAGTTGETEPETKPETKPEADTGPEPAPEAEAEDEQSEAEDKKAADEPEPESGAGESSDPDPAGDKAEAGKTGKTEKAGKTEDEEPEPDEKAEAAAEEGDSQADAPAESDDEAEDKAGDDEAEDETGDETGDGAADSKRVEKGEPVKDGK